MISPTVVDSPMKALRMLYALVVDQSTGSGWRIPALDGLRGVAALMVLIAHAMHAAEDPWFDSPAFAFIQRGGLGGVMLFFALSGFLLYLPWLRAAEASMPPPRFSKYALRRCLRIMPAYYASVLLLSVLRVVVAGREPLDWTPFLLHFVFLPTLGTPLLTVYWSLQVEEFFYWLLPWFDVLVRRFGMAALQLLAGGTCAVWFALAWFFPESERARWLQQTPFFLPAFTMGIWTAVRWRRSPEHPRAKLLAAAGTVGYVAISPLAWMVEIHRPWLAWVAGLAMAPLASMVVLGVAQGAAALLAHPVMRFVGGISFSLYLWHMVVIRNAPTPGVIANSFPLRALYALAISIPFATVSFLVTERPFLKIRPNALTAR